MKPAGVRATDSEFQRAVALQVSGRFAEAIESYRQVLELDEGLVEAHFNLGNSLLRIGAIEEAVAHFDRAIALRPAFAAAHDSRGRALQEFGSFAEAIPFHDRAIQLDPNLPHAHHNLGHALLRTGRAREAIAPLERAIALRPDFKEALNSLGAAQAAIGLLEESVVNYRRAIALDPGYADAHCNLGISLRDLGAIDEGLVHFQRAVDLEPRSGRFHRHRVDARISPVSENHLRQMEELATQRESLQLGQRIELLFALAKAYADRGDFDRSFASLRDGNALKRAVTPYDEAKVLGLFETMRLMFTKDLIRALSGTGDRSAKPAFIFGMPRSGTTLVEQILAAHPRVFAAGELDAFETALSGLSGVSGTGAGVVDAFADQLRKIGTRYAHEVESLAPSAARITDKMPWNFRFAGAIHLSLPNARLIHVRRDPVDTCLSCFFALFTEYQPYAYDLSELGRYYRAYERLMEHWREALPAGTMLEIRYEELVDNFDVQARRIVEHCGLEWDEACREFWSAKRPVRTASSVAVRQPLYRDAVGRNRAYGAHLEPLRIALGLET